MSDELKLSKVEEIKTDSIYLHGGLDKEMSSAGGAVSDEAYELLKFHGSYFGYDRDTATERKKAGLEKEWEFMVRMKAPGGRITAKQYLGLDETSRKYANGTLSITTRETFQFHCIIKENMKKHIADINHLLLTTLGGCGDVVRNVTTSSAPIKDKIHKKLIQDANAISEFTMPKTSAYHEIWLDGENLVRTGDNEDYEPLYGKVYLPRKFKISVSVPEDNSMDALTHDLAVIQIWENNELVGYNLLLGGGLGMTHNKPETFPRLASPIAFIPHDRLLDGVAAVVKIHKEYGDRSNRKHARLKYVVEEKGIKWTRSKLEELYGEKMSDPRPMGEFKIVDHMGWHEQGDGNWYLGIPIASGRIVDRDNEKICTGLREVICKWNMDVILTADQNIILCDIKENDKEQIAAQLKSYGIKLREDVSKIYRNMLACVALPTCGKALAEAERVQLPLVADFEKILDKHGMSEENLSIRIAGCPNGCSRPYVGDIGIVGRMPDNYAMFIGGDFEGTRLSTKLLDRVPYENLVEVLDLLFSEYVLGKNTGEAFGNYANRVGVLFLAKILEEKLGDKYKWAKAV